MESSESVTEIAKALIQAQKKIGAAKKGAVNPFFKSKYADLGSVLEACKDALNDNGIVILQPVSFSEDKTFVKTVLIHESGEYISSTMQLIYSKNDMQQAGSAITYARRYTLQSLISLPAEDDDGNKTAQYNGDYGKTSNTGKSYKPSDKQKNLLRKLAKEQGRNLEQLEEFLKQASGQDVSDKIGKLMEK